MMMVVLGMMMPEESAGDGARKGGEVTTMVTFWGMCAANLAAGVTDQKITSSSFALTMLLRMMIKRSALRQRRRAGGRPLDARHACMRLCLVTA
jgi:hypothetical protein